MAKTQIDVSHVATFIGLPSPAFVTQEVWAILRAAGPHLTLMRTLQLLSRLKGVIVTTRGNWSDYRFRVPFAAGVRFIAVRIDDTVIFAVESQLHSAKRALEEAETDRCARA